MGTGALTDDDVHVWYVRTDAVRDAGRLASYAELLASDERARHDRLRREADRHRFLVTRGTIRTLLGRYLGVDPRDCAFSANRHGRPSLSRPAGTGLEFNISHTEGLIACAIARQPEIGIDVEDVGRAVAPGLARRYFAPHEADALDALAEPARAARFFDYWTLKEAYVKARDLGLALPLDGFTMIVDGVGPPRIRFAPSIPDEADSWQFRQWSPTSRHRLALAVRRRGGAALAVTLQEFDGSDISDRP